MFSVCTTPWEFKNVTIPDQFGFAFEQEKTRSAIWDNYCDVIVFEKLRPHENKSQSVFEMLRFWDRLVWKVGLEKQTSVFSFLQQGLIRVGSLTRYIYFVLALINVLTNHESSDATTKGKHPERWSKGWSEVKNAAKKTADEQRVLPAKLIRYDTHENATKKKSEEDHRGWDESKWTTLAHQVKL